MYSQVRFGLITPQQVHGFLKATGSSDPDVLAAAKDQIAAPYRPVKWIGIWGMVVGVLCTMMVILFFIGIPVFIFGVWAFRREKKNRATIDAAYDEYIAKVTGQVVSGVSSTPLVPGAIRSVGLAVVAVAIATGLSVAA
jgi:ABC-type Fe3+ transport system permease subunit